MMMIIKHNDSFISDYGSTTTATTVTATAITTVDAITTVTTATATTNDITTTTPPTKNTATPKSEGASTKINKLDTKKKGKHLTFVSYQQRRCVLSNNLNKSYPNCRSICGMWRKYDFLKTF